MRSERSLLSVPLTTYPSKATPEVRSSFVPPYFQRRMCVSTLTSGKAGSPASWIPFPSLADATARSALSRKAVRRIELSEFLLTTRTTLAPLLTACSLAEASAARIVLTAPTPSARRIIVPAYGIATRTPIARIAAPTMFSISPNPREEWNLAITPAFSRGLVALRRSLRRVAGSGVAFPRGMRVNPISDELKVRRGERVNYWSNGQRKDRRP